MSISYNYIPINTVSYTMSYSYIDNPKMGIAYWAKFYSTDRHTMCKHPKIKEYKNVA